MEPMSSGKTKTLGTTVGFETGAMEEGFTESALNNRVNLEGEEGY